MRAVFAFFGFVGLAIATACSVEQELGYDRAGVDAFDAGKDRVPSDRDSGIETPQTRSHQASSRLAGGLEFTCAVTASGGVKCWGSNYYGTLGNGEKRSDSARAVDVVNLANVAGVTAFNEHACAWTVEGAVSCWGRRDSVVPVQNETATPSAVPTLQSGVVGVATGNMHACALRSDGSVACWGWNKYGQIGNGSESSSDTDTPQNVDGLADVKAIVAGQNHSCALMGDRVFCWGSNSSDQVGSPQTTNATRPVEVPGLSGVVAIASAHSATCAMNAEGAVKCWGATLGGTSLEEWQKLDLESLAFGGQCHVCGITKGKHALCWGCNSSGQFGDGTRTGTGPSGPDELDVAVLGGGMTHTCAITPAGGAKCWGSGGRGQLGRSVAPPENYAPGADVEGW